jgi:hypothetical protein
VSNPTIIIQEEKGGRRAYVFIKIKAGVIVREKDYEASRTNGV